MSTTDGIAIDHRNDGFGQTTNLHLHIEDTQARHALFIDIATTTFDVHITARAEGVLDISERLTLRHFRHGTCEQYHRDVLHLTAHGKGLGEFPGGLWGESIAILRTVDGDLGDAIIFLEDNLLELADFFPISHIFSVL